MTPIFKPGLRFLLVDDKQFIRDLIHSMLLRAKAADILHASSGSDALGVLAAKGSQIDCILCDWNMSPINGLELLQRIRAGQAVGCKPDICFVMVTGEADASVVNFAIVLDTNGYLVKPVSFDRLVTTAINAMEKRWSVKSPKYYRAVEGLPQLEAS